MAPLFNNGPIAPRPNLQTIVGNRIANVGLFTSVAANALTITLVNADGTSISASNPVFYTTQDSFGIGSSAEGELKIGQITSPMSIVVPAGGTLGHVSNVEEAIHVYIALNSSSTPRLMICTTRQGDPTSGSAVNPTVLSSGSTSRTTFYSDTSGSVGGDFEYVGAIYSTQSTAGQWAAAVTSRAVTFWPNVMSVAELWLAGSSGSGVGATFIPRYMNVIKNSSPSNHWTFTDSVTLGTSVTFNKEMKVSASITHNFNTDSSVGLSINAPNLSQRLLFIGFSNILCADYASSASQVCNSGAVFTAYPGDVLRPHVDNPTIGGVTNGFIFKVTELIY